MQGKFVRNNYMDTAKGIGIILVVMGHSYPPLPHFIDLFQMQLFFFISGYFYKDYYDEHPIELIFKRLKSLYIPFLLYSLFFLSLHNLLFKLNVYSSEVYFQGGNSHVYTLKNFMHNLISIVTFNNTEQLGGAFWFFTSLFTTVILFCFLRIISKKLLPDKYVTLLSVMIIILFIIGYYTKLPRSMSTSFVALFIYYLGYLYKKFEKGINLSGKFAVVCFLLLLRASFMGSINMSNNTYTSILFLIISSVLGIYMTIYMSKKIDHLGFKRFFQYPGENTVVILALHLLSFKIISLVQVLIYKNPLYMISKFPVLYSNRAWWIAYTIIGVAIPLFIKSNVTMVKRNIIKELSAKPLRENVNTEG